MRQLPKFNSENEDLSGEVSQDVDLFVLSLTGPFHVYFQHLFTNSVSSITDFSKDSTSPFVDTEGEDICTRKVRGLE